MSNWRKSPPSRALTRKWPPNCNAAPKKRGRPSADKRGGWIEFPVKSGKRYPRRRQWKKIDGQWRKVSLGKADELELMSEQEYQVYANNRERARAARRKNTYR